MNLKTLRLKCPENKRKEGRKGGKKENEEKSDYM